MAHADTFCGQMAHIGSALIKTANRPRRNYVTVTSLQCCRQANLGSNLGPQANLGSNLGYKLGHQVGASVFLLLTMINSLFWLVNTCIHLKNMMSSQWLKKEPYSGAFLAPELMFLSCLVLWGGVKSIELWDRVLALHYKEAVINNCWINLLSLQTWVTFSQKVNQHASLPSTCKCCPNCTICWYVQS